MDRKLYIIGTGGFSKEVAQLAAAIQAAGLASWSAIEYLCEHPSDIGKPMPFGAVTATDDWLHTLQEEADYTIGIGQPSVRRRIATKLALNPRLQAPNLIHPQAGIDALQAVRLGMGNIVTRGTAFTCDITVGSFNVFNLNCTVGHDCVVGSYNVINPGCNISGGLHMGDACLLGTGCQVLEGLSIVSNVTIGGGALVAKSISETGVYVGVPAKPLK